MKYTVFFTVEKSVRFFCKVNIFFRIINIDIKLRFIQLHLFVLYFIYLFSVFISFNVLLVVSRLVFIIKLRFLFFFTSEIGIFTYAYVFTKNLKNTVPLIISRLYREKIKSAMQSRTLKNEERWLFISAFYLIPKC